MDHSELQHLGASGVPGTLPFYAPQAGETAEERAEARLGGGGGVIASPAQRA